MSILVFVLFIVLEMYFKVMGDAAQLTEEEKEWLFECVRERDSSGSGVAAAALTALNRHRISLSDLDLSGVCVSGACLDYACLARTNFTNADLRYCSLRNVNLDGAILRGALLDGVELDELELVGECTVQAKAVAVAPTQEWLVVGTAQSVEVWSVETREKKWDKDMTLGVMSVCVTSDGDTIVCGEDTGSITLLTQDGDVVTEKGGAHANTIRDLALSSDEKLLATGSKDKKVKVWSMPELDLVACLEGHYRNVMGVQWLDESRLVSTSLDQTVKVWSVPEQIEVMSLTTESAVRPLSISSSQVFLAVGLGDGSVSMIDVFSLTRIASLCGHTRFVTSLCFHPSTEHILLSGSADRTIRVWDVVNQSCLRILHSYTLTVRSFSFAPDASFFISGSDDSRILKWKTGSVMQSSEIDPFHPSLAWSVAHCIGRQLMVKVVDGKQVHVMNIDGHNTVRVVEEESHIHSLAISADDSLVACSTPKSTKIYSSSDFSLVFVIGIRDLDWLRFSPDYQLLAGCNQETVYCFPLSASASAFSIAASSVCSLTFISRFLVAACENASIIIIDIHTQSIVKIIEEAHGWSTVTGLESIDDDHFVSVFRHGCIRTWSICTGHCCFDRIGLPGICSVVKHPSSGLIAVAHGYDRASIWSVDAEYHLSLSQFGHGVPLPSALDCQLNDQTSIDDGTLAILRRLGAKMFADGEDEKQEETVHV